MSEQPKSIWCNACRMSFPVQSRPLWGGGVETTCCTHEREGKTCRRPFWSFESSKYKVAKVGIEPHRLAEWQS